MDGISTNLGSVRSAPRCMPDSKKTQSKSGWVSVMFSIKISEGVIALGGQARIFASSVMSN